MSWRRRPQDGQADSVTDTAPPPMPPMPPLPADCVARPLTLDDVDGAFHVYAGAQQHDTGVVAVERADFVADWSKPSMDMERDTVGILHGGSLAASAEISRGGSRAEGAVHPDHRGLGLGTWLAEWVERRAAAMGAASVSQTVPRGGDAQRLFEARGYRLGHESWVLELPPGSEVPARDLPDGYRIRTSETDADHHAAYEAIDTAFGEWSDRSTETFEEWAAGTLHRPGYAPWQIRVVEHDEDGVVGAAFTVVDEAGSGYVGQLAVLREHRGRGLAQCLLADGFRNAREHGATRCELSTDSRTGALDLYRKVGMQVCATWQNYVTDLPRPAPVG